MNKKVVIGMSGGVDSSVGAYILKNSGYDVIGVTMQIWEDDLDGADERGGGCCGLSEVEDARRVANQLGIPYYVLNFKEEFNEKVIKYFINEYLKGRTPNPCIACNRYVKWQSLLQKAVGIGADYIATGHYARIGKYEGTGRLSIKKSATDTKDQTYALFNLTQEQLSRTLMPVGDYTKDEIRKMAKEIGLTVADKPDSQEICFVKNSDYAKYISENTNAQIKDGNFLDEKGNVLGRHKGIINYTIGQRKGLGIAFGKHMYVKKIDTEDNSVILSDDEGLYSKGLVAEDVNFMSFETIQGSIRGKAKIRYNHLGAECVAKLENGRLVLNFDEAQRAITPGQSVVLYDGDYIICGGTIVSEIG